MSIDTLKSGRGLALLLVAVAVAMFAGGAFASAAWSGDESKTVLNVNPSAWNPSGQASGAPAEPARDDGKAGMAQPGAAPEIDADRLASPIYWPGCQAPLPNILSGGGVSLAQAGFDLRPLGSGFSLISFAVRSEGECDDEGRATNGSLVVDTGWRHNDTELDVWVSQRVADEPVANVRYAESATVYDGGYTFNVNVNAYRILPYEKPLTAPDDAVTTSSLPYGSDPRAAGVLDAALAQVVPQIPAGCYYRQSEGAWDDLASLGVGDPRPAIPAGYTESYVSILIFTAPDAGCAGASLPNPVGAGSFNATFTNSAGDSIGVTAYAQPENSETYPGYMDEWSASWTRNGITFSIWGGKAEGTGIGAEVIQAIATAMDPAFTAICMPRSVVLQASGLEAYGIRSPLVPEGFTVTSFNGTTNAVDPACSNPDPNFRAETSASWTMESGEGVIEAFASKYNESTSPREGAIFENGIKWSDGKGGFYYVQAHSRGISPVFDRDTLIAVATSMDPEFDVTALEEVEASGGGSTGVARDLPAPESTR